VLSPSALHITTIKGQVPYTETKRSTVDVTQLKGEEEHVDMKSYDNKLYER